MSLYEGTKGLLFCRLLPARAQFVHRVGQFANLALADIALLLNQLTLRDFVYAASVDNSKCNNPGEVGHNQQDPQDL
jgi:hypothetical protein